MRTGSSWNQVLSAGVLFFGISNAYAGLKDFSKKNFPTNEIADYCKSDLYETALERSNDQSWRLAVSNEGGSLGWGNCWWHSTYQRNAFYRVVMRPDAKRPSIEEAQAIAKKLGQESGGVVEIPGFQSFIEFTDAYGSFVLKTIDEMHVWMNGFAEAFRLPPVGAPNSKSWAKSSRDKLIKLVDEKKLPLLNFSTNNSMYHAFIVTGYTKQDTGVVYFHVIDSNLPTSVSKENAFVYDPSSGYMIESRYPNDGRIGINVMRNSDFDRYVRARNSYCESKVLK